MDGWMDAYFLEGKGPFQDAWYRDWMEGGQHHQGQGLRSESPGIECGKHNHGA